jgi:tetratricopeptide (TPR) repeat protein
LNNVGLCLGAVGRAEEALQYSQDALAMYQRLYPGDHWHTAISLNNVAICLSAPGRPAEALEYYQKALAMFQRLYRGDHPAIAKGLNNVAVCLESLGRAAEAQPLYEEAVAMSRRQAYPEFHFWAANLARVYLGLDRAADAATLLTEAITQIESLRAAARGLSEQERAAYFTALKQYGAFETMVRAQLLLGNGDEALRYLEKGRARSLLDLLERSRFDPLQRIARRAAEQHDDPLLARIRQIQAALERADQEVGRLEHEIAMTRARRTEDEEALHKKQADLERLFAEQRAARVKQSEASRQWFELVAEALQMSPAREPAEIRQLLSPGQRLLIYSVTNADALLLVVPPPGEQIRGYRLTWPDGTKVTYDSLTATVEEYLRAIVRDGYATQRSGVESRLSELKTVTNLTPAQRGEIEDLNDTLTRLDRASLDVSKSESSGPGAAPATALGERLFAALIPLEVWAEIKDARLVYVVSDGALHRLPFETLIVSGGDTAEQRRYWLDDGPPIVYGPSGSALLWSQQRRSEQLVRQAEHAPLYEAVALGDPIFNRDPSQDAGLPLPDTGVLVLTVPPDSAASAAGLARGDVIVSYDGQNVADDLELQDRITEIEKAMRRAQRTREPVPLAVWRAGHQRELTIASGRLGVELATVPPPQAIAAIQGDTFDPKTMAVERGNLLTRYGGLEPLPGTRREVASIYRTLTGQDYSPSPAPVAAGLRTGRSGPEAPPASQPAGTNVAADVPVGRPAERPRGGAPASAPAATQPVRVLLGEDATETELYATAPQARFLHLATHQLADETEFASYSSLALTLPPVMTAADNGFLKLVDLFEHWRDRISRCELVVLSACETQRGRLQRDEGVFALPWGFMYAGAPSIVASLWRVNDVSTAELMSTFYERLRGGGHESKLSAFTEARRQLRRRYAEPYFWAPFVYMGDPR